MPSQTRLLPDARCEETASTTLIIRVVAALGMLTAELVPVPKPRRVTTKYKLRILDEPGRATGTGSALNILRRSAAPSEVRPALRGYRLQRPSSVRMVLTTDLRALYNPMRQDFPRKLDGGMPPATPFNFFK